MTYHVIRIIELDHVFQDLMEEKELSDQLSCIKNLISIM